MSTNSAAKKPAKSKSEASSRRGDAVRAAEAPSRAKKKPLTDRHRMQLEREIEESYDVFVSSFRSSLTHALEMGRRLLEMKAALGHGHFTPWLDNFCKRKGISTSTLRSYMQVAKRGHDLFKDDDPNLQPAGVLNLTEALELLKQPKPSPNGDAAPRTAYRGRRRPPTAERAGRR